MQTPSRIRRIVLWIEQTFCAHEYARHFTPGRTWLQCIHCQHETAGWELPKEAA